MMDLTYISSIAGKESVDDFLKEWPMGAAS